MKADIEQQPLGDISTNTGGPSRSSSTFARIIRLAVLILGVIVFSSLSFFVLNIQTRLEVRSPQESDSKGLKFKNCDNLFKIKGHYVSSHGLMYSANYIFVEDVFASERAMQGYGFLRMLKNMLKRYVLMPNCIIQNGNQIATIYVQSGLISTFARYSHSIPFDYTLMSGNDDHTVPQDLSKFAFDYVLSSPHLIKWYAQNLGIPERERNREGSGNNHKIQPIPIGLDYHTLANSPEKVPHWGPKASEMEQEIELNRILKEARPLKDRQIKIYSTFHLNYLPDDVKFFTDREEAYRDLQSDLVDHEESKVRRAETWKKQAEYSFVASPHGRGLDCHRTWEALMLGCIPVVKSSSLDSLYAGLPVLIVDKWKDVTLELLRATHANITADLDVSAYQQIQRLRTLHLSHWLKAIAAPLPASLTT